MFFFKLSAVKQSRVFKFLPLDVDAVLQFPMHDYGKGTYALKTLRKRYQMMQMPVKLNIQMSAKTVEPTFGDETTGRLKEVAVYRGSHENNFSVVQYSVYQI